MRGLHPCNLIVDNSKRADFSHSLPLRSTSSTLEASFLSSRSLQSPFFLEQGLATFNTSFQIPFLTPFLSYHTIPYKVQDADSLRNCVHVAVRHGVLCRSRALPSSSQARRIRFWHQLRRHSALLKWCSVQCPVPCGQRYRWRTRGYGNPLDQNHHYDHHSIDQLRYRA